MRDWTHNFGAVNAIAPAVLTDDPAAITIDRSGYDAVTFVLMLGVGGITFTNTNRIDFIVEHSDDGATWEAVDPTNLLGATPDASGIVLSQRTAHPAATVHRFGYVDGTVGDRRYVRLRADFNGTHGTGTPIAALAVLGNARTMPMAA
ncbi:hypothetical protein [Methylobacterium soli]|uniref:Uncharacterized protein n=1 Tax=Methylobacterium soli TaxID=553447 RepID=A0A6L3T821_9HYPH|nr:hypothetical protein [Methylobacterium soli]KAB1081721.1 hypothetical protein F6X53_01065 [Methylobacterium soli]GJE46189.1 hypothetical protein AEGHOMDF_5389 [Methylobacterium soli]